MTDRQDEDEPTGPEPTRDTVTPLRGSEGVRIIGAEEARAALDAGAAGRPVTDEPPATPTDDGDRADVVDEADEPTAEHPGLADEIAAATGAIGAAPDEAIETVSIFAADEVDETAEEWEPAALEDETGVGEGTAALPVTPPAPEGLPHWSEPATGEVPVIRGDWSEDVEPLEPVPAGPRFRTGSADWADDEHEAFSVLGEDLDEEPVTMAGTVEPTDEDRDFDRAVAARRVRPRPVRPRPPTGSERDELDVGSQRSETVVRIVTGLGIAALALVCLALGRATTAVLATAIVALATFELYQALHRRGFRPAAIIGLLGALTIVPVAYNQAEFAFPFTFALVTVFTLLWFVFEVVHARPMVNVAVTIGGFAYTAGLGAFAGLLLTYQNGVGLVLGVAIPAIAYDVCGYFVGSQFGKSRLVPHISPNKTVEGLIGGMAGAMIFAVLVVNRIHPWDDLGHAFALGLTVAIVAPLGDLAESMLKRDLGIKDFGSLLPGHGGVLDRFDSILFCLPAVYFLARALKIG